MSTSGKTVVVTGDASGIGKATVERLAADGAAVFCADIDSDLGEAMVTEAGHG